MKHIRILFIGPVMLFLGMIGSCGNDNNTEKSPAPDVFSEKMRAMTIREVTIPLYYEVVGTIAAKTSTVLSSKISGHIRQISVEEGSRVKTGDLLIEIDDRDIQARLNQARASFESTRKALDEIKQGIKQAGSQKKQAEANLDLARKTYDRFERLFKQKAVSRQELDTARAKLDVAKAQVSGAEEGIDGLLSRQEKAESSIDQARSAVEEANVMKSYTRITAPFDGQIIDKNAELGGLAVPGMSLLVLENSEGFRLEVDVREKEFANKVKVGRDVPVNIDALGNEIIYGRVAEIVPTANPLSRTFKVKIALPKIKGLSSGMYGKALCVRGERKGVLIPRQALIKRGQLEQVFSVDKNGIAKLRLVKSGKIFDNEIEILAGLRDGDTIITQPKTGLKDQHQVMVEVKK